MQQVVGLISGVGWVATRNPTPLLRSGRSPVIELLDYATPVLSIVEGLIQPTTL